jgi:hypothetical protein
MITNNIYYSIFIIFVCIAIIHTLLIYQKVEYNNIVVNTFNIYILFLFIQVVYLFKERKKINDILKRRILLLDSLLIMFCILITNTSSIVNKEVGFLFYIYIFIFVIISFIKIYVIIIENSYILCVYNILISILFITTVIIYDWNT